MRKHFFIIDDDEEEVQLLTAALNEMKVDHKCTWSKNGEQAFAQLQYLVPDVIFLDFNMPDINGLQCLKRIKSLPNCAHVPVILHSSCMTAEIQQQGMQLGAHDCIEKADSLYKLMDVLKQFVGERLVYRA
jgi:CheY-like chemotaxis protein